MYTKCVISSYNIIPALPCPAVLVFMRQYYCSCAILDPWYDRTRGGGSIRVVGNLLWSWYIWHMIINEEELAIYCEAHTYDINDHQCIINSYMKTHLHVHHIWSWYAYDDTSFVNNHAYHIISYINININKHTPLESIISYTNYNIIFKLARAFIIYRLHSNRLLIQLLLGPLW